MSIWGTLTRRSFLVRMGATVLGTYLMPPHSADAAEPAAPADVAEAQEQLSRVIFGPPKKIMDNPWGDFLLQWLESTDEGNRLMVWMPKDEQDVAEMQRFYEDTRRPRGPLPPADTAVPTRSAEELKLIRACLDRPDDVDASLAYARWLERQGNEQGTFARLQLEVSQLGSNDPGGDEMETRSWEMLAAHGEEWFRPLTDLGLRFELYGHFTPMAWVGGQGFVRRVEITWPGIIPERAKQLFYHAPLIQTIKFDHEALDLKGIASCAEMEQVTRLDFHCVGVTAAQLQPLASSPHLIRVRDLNLSSNLLGPEGAAVLAASPLLPRLHTLGLARNWLGSEGVEALCAAPGPAQLTSLNLGNNRLDDDALSALANAPLCERLTTLNLGSSAFSAEGMRALREAPWLRTLTSLVLSCCQLDVEAIAALASLPFASLTALDLGNNGPLGTEGVQPLATSTALNRLRTLSLAGWQLGDEGAQALADSSLLAEVAELDLNYNSMGARGVQALLGSPRLGKLRKLSLGWSKLGADAAKVLAMSPALADLTELVLWSNPLGPGGAIVLTKSPYLKNLESLSVTADAIGEAGQKALVAHFGEDVVKLG